VELRRNSVTFPHQPNGQEDVVFDAPVAEGGTARVVRLRDHLFLVMADGPSLVDGMGSRILKMDDWRRVADHLDAAFDDPDTDPKATEFLIRLIDEPEEAEVEMLAHVRRDP